MTETWRITEYVSVSESDNTICVAGYVIDLVSDITIS